MNHDQPINAHAGVNYTIEVIRGGAVVDSETVHNLMPEEGRNHAVSVITKGATQVPTWYIGLFEGNYVPVDSDKASTFPTSATECTAYLPATRVEFVEGAVAAGVVENTASRAEFGARISKELLRGSASTAVLPTAATPGTDTPLPSASRCTSWAMSLATTCCNGTISISVAAGWSSAAMILAMRCRFSA